MSQFLLDVQQKSATVIRQDIEIKNAISDLRDAPPKDQHALTVVAQVHCCS